jgi:hypothetical protein
MSLKKKVREEYMMFWYINTVPVSGNEGMPSLLQNGRKNISFSA